MVHRRCVVTVVGAVALAALGWLALLCQHSQARSTSAADARLTPEQRVQRLFEGLSALENPPLHGAVWGLSCGLGNIGPEAVPALAEALEASGDDLRMTRYRHMIAAQALGCIGTEEAIETLLQAPTSLAEPHLVEGMSIAGAKATKQLIAALSSPRREVRILAVKAMGLIRDGAFVAPLLGLLGDEDEFLVGKACLALGRIGDPAAVDPLIAILRGRESFASYPRQCAAEALGRIGCPRAFEDLIAALEGEDEAVAAGAADALRRLGNPGAVPALIRALKRENAELQADACRALGGLRDRRAVSALAALLEQGEPGNVFSWTGEALAGIGDPAAVGAFKRRLADDKIALVGRMQLAKQLSRLGRPGMEALVRLLTSQDAEVRASAACGLCVQGDMRGLLLLLAAWTDGAAATLKFHAIRQLIGKAPQEIAALLSPDGADPEVRRKVAEVLPWAHRESERGLPDEVMRALRQAACTDPDPAVRKAALHAVQRLGWPAWD